MRMVHAIVAGINLAIFLQDLAILSVGQQTLLKHKDLISSRPAGDRDIVSCPRPSCPMSGVTGWMGGGDTEDRTEQTVSRRQGQSVRANGGSCAHFVPSLRPLDSHTDSDVSVCLCGRQELPHPLTHRIILFFNPLSCLSAVPSST